MADKKEYSTPTISRKTGWSELPVDLCAMILPKLSVKSVVFFEAVCRSWFKAVKYILSSSSSFTCLPEPPWLLVPQDNNVTSNVCDRDGDFRFYSLEGKVYNSKTMPKELRCSICLGSSHGFLLLLNSKKQELELILLNPLSGTQIPLPPLNNFPKILGIITYLYGGCGIELSIPDYPTPQIKDIDVNPLNNFREKITKAVVCPRPSWKNKNNLGVVVMYNFEQVSWEPKSISSLAFCRTGDRNWTELDESRWFIDIMSYDNHVYALCGDYSVIIWDFLHSFPSKKMEIRPEAFDTQLPASWIKRPYIIKTTEDLLLVVTCGGYSRGTSPLRVYKLESCSDGSSRWIKLESIGNLALVISSSQCTVISTLDSPGFCGNSIYCRGMGHGLGVFNLRDKRVRKVFDIPMKAPPDIWVDPNAFS